jgi:hypothetical protein
LPTTLPLYSSNIAAKMDLIPGIAASPFMTVTPACILQVSNFVLKIITAALAPIMADTFISAGKGLEHVVRELIAGHLLLIFEFVLKF